MRKALVVGIDYYEKINPLYGCVNDAHSVKAVLDRNSMSAGAKLGHSSPRKRRSAAE